MAAEDELALPAIPDAEPEDPEDVSWALSTAEAMWARGDHLEGIKWVRKAAEAASDVENDERALQLAKAASELTSLIARRSRASIGEGPGYAGGAPPEPAPSPTSSQPTSVSPSTTRSGAPPMPSGAQSRPPPMNRSVPPGPPAPAGYIPAQSAQSAPPAPTGAGSAPPALFGGGPSAASGGPGAPFGSSGSNAPPAPGRSALPLPLPSRASVGPRAPQPPRTAPPRPLATDDARQGPQAGRGFLTNRGALPKARRRSRENLEVEAKAAGALDTAPHAALDGNSAERTLANARAKRRSRPEPEPTVIGKLDDLVESERAKSAVEWDTSPTQNLSGDEMDHMNVGDRETAFAMPAAAPPISVSPPAPRAPTSAVHDPEIVTSQAVRVVVWRDGNGVHIAPAGTVVSSITIDAVLVVLEAGVDSTAWLSRRALSRRDR